MKRIQNIGIITILTIIIGLGSGCSKINKIEGNGAIAKEIRHSVSFNKVENEGDFDVYIIPDSVFYVEIEAESNLLPHIRTNVHGNVLEIDTRENLGNNFAMNIMVHTPVLTGAILSGSGIVDVGYFENDSFDAILSGSGKIYGEVKAVNFNSRLSGSGDIDFMVESQNVYSSISGSGRTIVSGQANYADLEISGSGNIEAYALPLFECRAKISGSGNIYTEVSDILNVTISGSGNLYYRGTPVINSTITGSGQIIGQ